MSREMMGFGILALLALLAALALAWRSYHSLDRRLVRSRKREIARGAAKSAERGETTDVAAN